MVDVVDPVDESIVDETPEAPVVELTPEEQETQDALLQVNGDIEGEVKPNRPLDEGVQDEEIPETELESEEDPGETPTEGEPSAEVTTAPQEEIAPEKDETGVYAPVTTDPGDFKPGDYSFTIQTTDGKVHKISTPEDAESFAAQLDNSPDMIAASQFLALGRKTSMMEQGLATDKRAYDAIKEQHDLQTSQQATREQYLTQWQGEVKYLRDKGDLPPITDELNKADWTDPKVATEPGVKETLALYKYMEEENNRRMAAGLPPDLSVVSANTSMRLEERLNLDKEEVESNKTRQRSRGSMVTGKSPHIPANASKGTLIGEPKGLEQLATEAYYAQQE